MLIIKEIRFKVIIYVRVCVKYAIFSMTGSCLTMRNLKEKENGILKHITAFKMNVLVKRLLKRVE